MTRVLPLSIMAFFLLGAPAFAQTTAETQTRLLSLQARINAHSLLSPKWKGVAVAKMLPLVTHPLLVEETVRQNGKGMGLAEIRKIDRKWVKAAGLPIQREKLDNGVARALRAWIARNPEITKVFVMDDQGPVVGETGLTTDHWQGDEAKWKKAFKGGVDVGSVNFDRSAKRPLKFLSLPLIAPGGAIVGAVAFGFEDK